MRIIKNITPKFRYAFAYKYDPYVLEVCRSLKEKYGYKSFGWSDKAWRFNDLSIIEDIQNKCSEAVVDISVSEDLKRWEQDKKEAEAREARALEIKTATKSSLKVEGLTMPLYPYQALGVEFFINNNGKAILADTMGLGKQQSVNSLIMTPNGPKKIGEAKIGDKILTADGTVTHITGVFPQGRKEIYEITMRDGGKTLAGPEHLWAAYNQNDIKRKKGYKIVNTEYIYNNGLQEKDGSFRWSIPLQKEMQFSKKETNIDPYLLGILIGDGYLLKTVSFSCSSKEKKILKAVEKLVKNDYNLRGRETSVGCSQYTISNGKKGSFSCAIKNGIKELGLNVKSGKKFIPKNYLFSSIEDRKKILGGLMDTDGSCCKNRTSFSTTSKQLANDMAFLVRSLGGEAIIRVSDRHKENKTTEYGVNVRVSFNPFINSVKKRRWHLMKNFKFKYRRIKNIEPIGREECVCISVDHESKLYVTDDFIVTHNTVQSLGYITHTKQKKSLIVCPASIKYSWESEIKIWTKLKTFVVDSKTGITDEDWNSNDIIIINYDIMNKYFKFLINKKIDCIVCDEFHIIKNSSAQRTKVTKAIAMDCPSVLLLSGTPILSRPEEMFNGLNLMDPLIWNDWYHFTKKYCDGKQGRFGYEAKGVSNIKELQQKISKYFLRRTKEEVLKELPPKRFLNISVPLSDDAKKDYLFAQNNFLEYLRDVKEKKKDQIDKIAQAQTLVMLNELKSITSRGKVDAARDIIQSIVDSGEKVIVFSIYNEPLETLFENFKDISVLLTGKTDNRERQAIKEKFQEDPKTKIFFGGMKSAGVGITLTAASNVVFLDFSWVPADHWQAIDRAHRIGQTADVVTSYQLYSKDTIDEYMKEILKSKEKIFNALIDAKEVQISNQKDTNIIRELLKKFTASIR